jgi:hypothetical protein
MRKNSSVATSNLTTASRKTVPLGTLWHAKVMSQGLCFTAKVLLLFIPEKQVLGGSLKGAKNILRVPWRWQLVKPPNTSTKYILNSFRIIQ